MSTQFTGSEFTSHSIHWTLPTCCTSNRQLMTILPKPRRLGLNGRRLQTTILCIEWSWLYREYWDGIQYCYESGHSSICTRVDFKPFNMSIDGEIISNGLHFQLTSNLFQRQTINEFCQNIMTMSCNRHSV